jgi:hypothetical protein
MRPDADRGVRHQRRTLTRLFFDRFFENELVSSSVDARQATIWALAILAAPAIYYPVHLLPKYVYLQHRRPASLEPALLGDALFLIIYAMATAGLVGVIVWDALLLDRRDCLGLGPLPVAARTILGAKLTALLAFVLLFAVGINVAPSMLFAAAVAQVRPDVGFFTLVVVQIGCSAGAGLFVFLSLVAMQGVLIDVLPPAWFRRASTLLQVVTVASLLSFFLFAPALMGSVIRALRPDTSDGLLLLRLTPPAWFLSLQASLTGLASSDLAWLARYAVLGLLSAGAAAAGAYAFTYARIARLAIEGRDEGTSRRPHRARALVGLITRAAAPQPQVRAICGFAVKSLARSRRHRLLLAMYVGAACAISVTGLLGAAARGGIAALRVPSVAVLAPALILTSLTLVGVRVLFSIPTELAANWIFRSAGATLAADLRDAARHAMFVMALAPVLLALAPVYAALLGPALAIRHLLVTLVLSWLLVEALLYRFRKVPFTCSYLPGRGRLTEFWPLYLIAFSTYAYTIPRYERALLDRPGAWAATVIGLGIAVVALRVWTDRASPRDEELVYDEQREPLLQTLAISGPTRVL